MTDAQEGLTAEQAPYMLEATRGIGAIARVLPLEDLFEHYRAARRAAAQLVSAEELTPEEYALACARLSYVLALQDLVSAHEHLTDIESRVQAATAVRARGEAQQAMQDLPPSRRPDDDVWWDGKS